MPWERSVGSWWLKPNGEKPRERGSAERLSAPVYPPSTAGLLPLRGKPRERGLDAIWPRRAARILLDRCEPRVW